MQFTSVLRRRVTYPDRPSFRDEVRSLARRHPGLVLIGAVLMIHALAWPFVDAWIRAVSDLGTPIGFNDFSAYTGAYNDWQAGETLYPRNEDGGFFGGYLYPPLALLLFAPFAELFDFRMAAISFEVVSFVLLWLGVQAVIAELGYSLRWWQRLLLAWLLVGYQPVLFGLKWGQTPAFNGAMLCFAYVGLSRQLRTRRDRRRTGWGLLSGVLTALVGFVKFAYAPIGAHLLTDRTRFLGAVGAGVLLVGASVAIFGVDSNLLYVEVLLWGTETGDPRSPTLWLEPYFKPLGWLSGEVLGVSTALLARGLLSATIALAALASSGRDHAAFALGAAAFPVLAPTTYAYYLVATIPAALIVTKLELDRDGAPWIPALGLWLAASHAWGLFLIGQTVPGWLAAVGIESGIDWLLFLLQPGLWGCALVAGVAFLHVIDGVPQLSTSLDRTSGPTR